MKSIVLVSGGMDSAVALASASLTSEEVLALSIRYGSTHQQSEMAAAVALADYYEVDHEVLDLPNSIFRGGSSALLGEVPIPAEEYHDIEKESPSQTVVPFRNAILISSAVAQAEARGYDYVWAAMHATDHGGWAYPDCSPEFVGAMASAVYVGTLRKVRLYTPFLFATKADIVVLGDSLDVPFDLTYSCYRGGNIHCGECPTCLERRKAFDTAGMEDPTEYMK